MFLLFLLDYIHCRLNWDTGCWSFLVWSLTGDSRAIRLKWPTPWPVSIALSAPTPLPQKECEPCEEGAGQATLAVYLLAPPRQEWYDLIFFIISIECSGLSPVPGYNPDRWLWTYTCRWLSPVLESRYLPWPLHPGDWPHHWATQN